MGQEEVPSMSRCLSLYLKLTTNCVPLSRLKGEREIFYEEMCFVLSLKFVLYLLLCSWLGSIQHEIEKRIYKVRSICSLSDWENKIDLEIRETELIEKLLYIYIYIYIYI